MTDATKRGRPCLGFLARGERERTQGTCSTCDLPAAAHHRIIFYAVTLPPLVAGAPAADGNGWDYPLPFRSANLWRPPTLVTVGIQRDSFGRSAYLAFQEAAGREFGGVELVGLGVLRHDRIGSLFIARRTFAKWARDAETRHGGALSWGDLDVSAVARALDAARETLELEDKAERRAGP